MLSTMISRHSLDHSMRPMCANHNCCNVVTPLSVHSCHSLISTPETLCGCSGMTHQCVTHLSVPQRCSWTNNCPHFPRVTCKAVDAQSTYPSLTPLRVYEAVLARRYHDGFYYLATVKQEEEHGMFLIEFNKPCAEGERYQTMLQKTEAGDIIDYFDALRHSIVPGDNVLAPWETDVTRFGPGVVTMGLETRDPLRGTVYMSHSVIFMAPCTGLKVIIHPVKHLLEFMFIVYFCQSEASKVKFETHLNIDTDSLKKTTVCSQSPVSLGEEEKQTMEDEELTVSFWNGKKVNVPIGVAVWISPSVYRMVLDKLHMPISTKQKLWGSDPLSTTYVFTDRFTSVPDRMCTTDHFCKHKWHHHGAHTQHIHQHCSCCCFPTQSKCTCCYNPKCEHWWPLSPTTTVYVQSRKEKEDDEKNKTINKERESPKTDTSLLYSSYSSLSDDDSDDQSDGETYLSKSTLSTMVDSAVNTDSSLWDKPSLYSGERPEWRYWKRSHPEPSHRKPGGSISRNKLKNKMPTSDSRVSFSDATNQSALFDTIFDSPLKRLTMKDVLVHKDFDPTYKQHAAPVVERLGESEVEKLLQRQTLLEQKQKRNMQHRDWEQKREQYIDQKYSDTQEAHRNKTLRHLQNEDRKVKEQQIKNVQNINAKKKVHENISLRTQTLAAEDKKKEQRRLDHLRHVREKIDQKEFEKCVINEQKEINNAEARRRRVDNHYRQVADKVFEAEQKEMQNGNH
ncbi:uncharacterized protein C11orf16 homolog [Bombina bombina]|uniref:uncharacterized protein C11orf16 homolog n=1 Tax=Bombina bombina TaxID=8345 RepID=UPI00235B00F7|nr:uncharacterized protein C11orf16 homolog [Bombina bombina]